MEPNVRPVHNADSPARSQGTNRGEYSPIKPGPGAKLFLANTKSAVETSIENRRHQWRMSIAIKLTFVANRQPYQDLKWTDRNANVANLNRIACIPIREVFEERLHKWGLSLIIRE